MAAGEHLDRLGVGAVTGDRAMVVPVGADQIGEHLGVTGVGLRARDVVAVPIAGHRQRVDRVHLIAGRDQRRAPTGPGRSRSRRPPRRVIGVAGDELVEPADPVQALRESPSWPAVHRPRSSDGRRDGPQPSHRPRRSSSSCLLARSVAVRARRTPGGDLMDQCSRHDTPSALQAALTNQPGHDLTLGIDAPGAAVLTGRRLGTSLSRWGRFRSEAC